MAKKKISGLPAGSALNGTELVPIVQTGTTKRITTQDIANLGNASGVEGSGTINNLAKFTASSTIGNSAFFDDGTNQGTETTTAVNRFIMSANASIAKIFSFRSGNLPRWAFRVDGTESGANAGADLAIRRYNDAGTYIDSPMSFDRSDGTASILKDATINSVNVGRGAGNIATNTAVGFEAINSNVSGTDVTAIGYRALKFSTGVSNTAVGSQALTANTTGVNNTALGKSALIANTTGFTNTAIGESALFANVGGTFNTAIGSASLSSNVSGSNNVAIGRVALQNNTASNNVAVGFEAANANTSGSVTAIGYQALKGNTTGANNTALGNSAMSANTTGNNNVAIGGLAMQSGTASSNAIAIGYGAQAAGFSGGVTIGRSATATANNQFVIGSSGYPAGAVATETVVSDATWSVIINGTAYKILLKA